MSVFVPLDVHITVEAVRQFEDLYVVNISYVYDIYCKQGILMGVEDIWESDLLESLDEARILRHEIRQYIKTLKQWP